MGNSKENKYGRYGGDISLFEDIKEHMLARGKGSKGGGFSYSFIIGTEKTYFEWHKSWLGNRWKKTSTSRISGYLQYEEDKESIRKMGYLGISYEEVPKQLYDHRREAENRRYKKADILDGFLVTVSVDDKTAKLIYEDTWRKAEEFKNYLLTSRKDVLELIAYYEGIRKPNYYYGEYKYYIGGGGIYSYNPPKIYSRDLDEITGHVCSFKELGLKPLEEIEKRYGLGLALVELVLKDPHCAYQAHDRSIQPCGPNYPYIVEVSLKKKEEKTLNPW